MDTLIELFGYLGSALVIVSMLMTSVLKLRIINTAGSVVCVIYGLIIQSYPTVVMNLALIAINVYGMLKLTNKSPEYHLEVGRATDATVAFLLKKYKGDMARYFSAFQGAEEGQTAYLVMNGDLCVGLALGTLREGRLDCTLDYTTPSYRDFSIGQFLYPKLKELGVEKIVYSGPAGHHESYMKRMGFVEENGAYIKTL